MKCQILLCGKYKKTITNLSSAALTQIVVTVNSAKVWLSKLFQKLTLFGSYRRHRFCKRGMMKVLATL